MRSRCLALIGAVLAFAAILGAGCGSGTPTADTAPFEAAVNTYLRSQSMDMKAGRFRALDVLDNAATATVSLAHADGAAGVSVQWEFSFARQNGTWTVSSCRRR